MVIILGCLYIPNIPLIRGWGPNPTKSPDIRSPVQLCCATSTGGLLVSELGWFCPVKRSQRWVLKRLVTARSQRVAPAVISIVRLLRACTKRTFSKLHLGLHLSPQTLKHEVLRQPKPVVATAHPRNPRPCSPEPYNLRPQTQEGSRVLGCLRRSRPMAADAAQSSVPSRLGRSTYRGLERTPCPKTAVWIENFRTQSFR